MDQKSGHFKSVNLKSKFKFISKFPNTTLRVFGGGGGDGGLYPKNVCVANKNHFSLIKYFPHPNA